MKKSHLVFIFLLTTLYSFGQAEINYEKGKTYSENQLGIDTFNFVHQIFADAFFMNGLSKQLTHDEMYSILNTVYYSITKEDKVLVIIPQEEGPDARLAFEFFPDTKKLGDILVLATNFNNETRVFEKKIDRDNSIYRWYKIEKEKLVYRKDVYSKKAERENKKKNGYSIIGMYLFDDNFENDNKVKPTIDTLLASETTDLETLYGYLYLSEYWLMNNDLIQSEEAVEKVMLLLNTSETIPKNYALLGTMATTELEMMKRFVK